MQCFAAFNCVIVHNRFVRSLAAQLRVFCVTHYYGPHCDVYCRPDEKYDCDSSGQRMCRPGRPTSSTIAITTTEQNIIDNFWHRYSGFVYDHISFHKPQNQIFQELGYIGATCDASPKILNGKRQFTFVSSSDYTLSFLHVRKCCLCRGIYNTGRKIQNQMEEVENIGHGKWMTI